MTYFYLYAIFLYAMSAVFYALFRGEVDAHLRSQHVSRSMIKKCKKTPRDRWWYEALNEKHPLGAVYHLNKAFTVLFPVGAFLTLATGWIKVMSIPLTVICAAVAVILCALNWFSFTSRNERLFGTKYVLLRRDRENEQYSHHRFSFACIVTDVFSAVFPLLLMLPLLDALNGIWNFGWNL